MHEASNNGQELLASLTLILESIEDAVERGVLEGEDLKAVHRCALRLLPLVNSLLERLAHKNTEIDAFRHSVSHDLRAPLRGINGFARALVEDHASELGAKAQEYLRRVCSAADRMGQLIDGLLDLSRIDGAELVRRRVELSSSASRVVAAMTRRDPGRTAEFVIQPDVVAHVDARLIETVLDHLLCNAWKFTSKTARARIEFGSFEADGVTAFFVRDNGAGFNPAYASKLFGPFQRLHSDEDYPGTGVGLAIVSRVIARHGGRVWAEGMTAKGATFFWTVSPNGESSVPARDAKEPSASADDPGE